MYVTQGCIAVCMEHVVVPQSSKSIEFYLEKITIHVIMYVTMRLYECLCFQVAAKLSCAHACKCAYECGACSHDHAQLRSFLCVRAHT
jgi:hypothetical protein